MLAYTRSALDKIICDLKSFYYTFLVIANISYIFAPFYAITTGNGSFTVNIILLTAAVAYFVYFLITTVKRIKSSANKIVKKYYNALRIILNGVTLFLTVYSIYVASENVTPISLMIVMASIITWLFSVFFALIISFVENRAELLTSAILADFEIIARPVNAVNSFIKKVQGEESAEDIIPTVNDKMSKKLSLIKEKFKNKKLKEKEEARRLKQEQKDEGDYVHR